MIPKTKSDVLTYMEEKIRIDYSPEFLNGIYTFLKDIGMGREVVGLTKDELLERVLHIHDLVAIRNPSFPPSLPFDMVYPAFFEYCIYRYNDQPIHTTSGIIKAFTTWITTTHDIEKIRDEYYDNHPTAQPKALEPQQTKTGKGSMESWSNEEIERQLKTLFTIYKDDPDRIYLPDGGDGYISRLLAEARKRNIETTFSY